MQLFSHEFLWCLCPSSWMSEWQLTGVAMSSLFVGTHQHRVDCKVRKKDRSTSTILTCYIKPTGLWLVSWTSGAFHCETEFSGEFFLLLPPSKNFYKWMLTPCFVILELLHQASFIYPCHRKQKKERTQLQIFPDFALLYLFRYHNRRLLQCPFVPWWCYLKTLITHTMHIFHVYVIKSDKDWNWQNLRIKLNLAFCKYQVTHSVLRFSPLTCTFSFKVNYLKDTTNNKIFFRSHE